MGRGGGGGDGERTAGAGGEEEVRGEETVYTNSTDRGRETGRKRKGKMKRRGERWQETDKRKIFIPTDPRSYPNLDLQKDAMHLLGWPHCCYGNPSRA